VTDAVLLAPMPVAVFRGPDQCVVASAPWQRLFRTEVPASLRAKIDEVLRSGQSAEADLRGHDALDAWEYRVVIQPLADGVMATCIDRSELHRARAEAARAVRLKDEVLLAVSHDLRGPMSTIMLWERVLRERIGESEVCLRALDAIRESAVAQTSMISELVEVSSLLATKVLDRERISIESILTTVIELSRDASGKRSLVADYKAPLGHVVGDRTWLRRAFAAIVGYAMKASPSGTTLTVAARRKDTMISISIGDADIEPSHDLETHALPLSIVLASEVVAMHGGVVDKTRSDAGPLRFWIRLPLAVRHAITA